MMVSDTRVTAQVPPAAEVAGRQAQRDADHERQRHRRHRDAQVQPRGHEGAAEDVAAQRVGAEPVLQRGGFSATAALLASGS
jgi:hypothetical protein